MRAPHPDVRHISVGSGATLAVVGALLTAFALGGGLLREQAAADGSQNRRLVSTTATEGRHRAPIGHDIDAQVTVQVLTYGPGQSSGWHRHAGVHSVAVMSGALTIVDAACTVSTHTSDEPYVGGLGAHLVINETDVPVQVVVTHVAPAYVDAENATVVVPAPRGCRSR